MGSVADMMGLVHAHAYLDMFLTPSLEIYPFPRLADCYRSQAEHELNSIGVDFGRIEGEGRCVGQATKRGRGA